MRNRLAHWAIAAAVLALTGAGAAQARDQESGEAKLAKLLEGRVAGKPQSCIPLGRGNTESQVIDHTAIVYRVGDTLYVNRPQTGAESLDWTSILVTESWTNQLCNLDTVRLVERGGGFMTGFVGLGDFVPYTRERGGRGGR
jgi:hypothetical protein